jgi:hypothetical protein
MSDRTYGGKEQADFFFGVEQAAQAHGHAYGVSAHQVLSDLCANLLSCVMVEGSEEEFASLMVKAQDQAARVIQRRAERQAEQAVIIEGVNASGV